MNAITGPPQHTTHKLPHLSSLLTSASQIMSGTVDPTATAGPGTGGSGLTAGGSGRTPSTGSSTPNMEDIFVYKKSFPPDPSWPAELILDGLKCNWEEWNQQLNLVVDQ